MWQQNTPKGRKKKQKALAQSKPKSPRFHVKRVGADIRLVGSDDVVIVEGRLLLNDLSPKGFSIFSTELIPNGQEVAITLEEPRGLYLRGRVVSGHDHNATSHILTSTPFQFRLQIRLTFDSPEDEQRMRDFCLKLAREELYPEEEDLSQAA